MANSLPSKSCHVAKTTSLAHRAESIATPSEHRIASRPTLPNTILLTGQMGTSHSTIGDRDSIPVELVIKILLYLSVADLTSCQSVNRTLHNIIDGSQHIQHQIATALAGVVDNPSATLSFPERRRALACRQEAWDNFKPQFTTTSNVPWHCFPDFIQEGVYFKLHYNLVGYCFPPQPEKSFDGSWSSISPLPR